MSAVKTPILTDSWISMDWDTFVSQSEDPALAKAKSYYYQGHGRFEMLPVGRGHAGDHVMVGNAINLFCILKAAMQSMQSEDYPFVEEFVTDNSGQVCKVVLQLADYRRLIAALEDEG